MLDYGPDILHDLDESRSREWLETNGLGGYASSTLCLCNSRRYHALLVAATRPPIQRRVLLSKLDLTLQCADGRFDLDVNQYPGAIFPHGHLLLESFRATPWPTWIYRAGSARLQQQILMIRERNLTLIRLTLLDSDAEIRLEARPKTTSRDHHHLMHCAQLGEPSVDAAPQQLTLRWPHDPTPLILWHNGGFVAEATWYWNCEYPVEIERGFDAHEDLFCPGTLLWTLRPGDSAVVAAGSDLTNDDDLTRLVRDEQRRRSALPPRLEVGARTAAKKLPAALTDDPLAAALLRASSDFLVRREDGGWSVIAGYPWFTDWGRDTFISLPGLTLTTGRINIARAILLTFANYVRDGLVPNRFPDAGQEPEYNSIDAALWFVHALGKYVEYSGDEPFALELFPVVGQILERFERGTHFGIRLDQDGLVRWHEEGLALTWMDARVSGRPITPRMGKPVEIQGLWHRALEVGVRLAAASRDERSAARFADLQHRAASAFPRTFWNEARGCCFDTVSDDGVGDPAVRPNQVITAALAPSLLTTEQRRALLEVVRKELLTPLGLRTLAPADPSYIRWYAGGPAARDEAYHQGTVWPWLLGPFVSAWVSTYEKTPAARRMARAFLDPLSAYLGAAGIGFVSEVADGDAPHRPGGCIAQAWSVAEPLRALAEDVLALEPPAVRRPAKSSKRQAGTKVP